MLTLGSAANCASLAAAKSDSCDADSGMNLRRSRVCQCVAMKIPRAECARRAAAPLARPTHAVRSARCWHEPAAGHSGGAAARRAAQSHQGLCQEGRRGRARARRPPAAMARLHAGAGARQMRCAPVARVARRPGAPHAACIAPRAAARRPARPGAGAQATDSGGARGGGGGGQQAAGCGRRSAERGSGGGEECEADVAAQAGIGAAYGVRSKGTQTVARHSVGKLFGGRPCSA
jgi:hypothetical protein